MDAGVKSSKTYTVREAVEDWLREGLDGTSERTRTLYQGLLGPLLDAIGARPLRVLSAGDVRSGLGKLADRYSTRSLQITRLSLERAIRHAEADDLVGRNVAAERCSDEAVGLLEPLPHGPEFRFLDRLLNLDPGQSGVGEHRVRSDEPFLRGHFPGQPLFPGVLLIEAAAQLAGTVAQSDPRQIPLPGLKLTAIRGVKISGTAGPGEIIRVEARIVQRLGNLVQAQVSASVNGRTVMQGELTLAGETK